jgi:hypothetical protein
LQDTPKSTQIWIFGLKTNHLATLLASEAVVNPEIIGLTHTNSLHRYATVATYRVAKLWAKFGFNGN